MASCTDESKETSIGHYSDEEILAVKELAQIYGLDIVFNNNFFGEKLAIEDFNAVFEEISSHPDAYVSEIHEINDSTYSVVYDSSMLVGMARIESESEITPFSLASKTTGAYTISITIGVPSGDSASIDWTIKDDTSNLTCSGQANGSHDRYTHNITFSFEPTFITEGNDTVVFNVQDGICYVFTQSGSYVFDYKGFHAYQRKDE